jgi:osmotically-inducible protein OsmY
MKTDDELKYNILNELSCDPNVDVTEIGVAVKEGVVTLYGTVDHYSGKLGCVAAVQRVPEVKALASDIKIRPFESSPVIDTDIALRVSRALELDALVPNEHIQVQIEDGWVILKGEVMQQEQKSAAYAALNDLSGVKGVINEITVKHTGIKREVRMPLDSAVSQKV